MKTNEPFQNDTIVFEDGNNNMNPEVQDPIKKKKNRRYIPKNQYRRLKKKTMKQNFQFPPYG